MRYKIYQYLSVGVGCLLSAVAINSFLVPHHLLSGGVSGIAIILYYLFKFPIGVQILAMNVPLVYAAYRLLGKEYTIKTLYGTALFSFFVDATDYLANFTVVDDPILSAITGGIVTGIGSGLIFKANGSGGGLDIVSSIIKKYYSMNVGAASFSINCMIMLIAAILFGIKLAILTLISMFIAANITDNVVEGINRKKTVYIVSYKTDEILKAILKEVGRGATILRGEGAFTRQDKQVIFVVVTLTQIGQIKLLVQESDPNAFMIVQDAVEVMGRGFTLPSTKQL
ncbi:YitT family protein [Pelosinus sp. IPA-1]|uniref:YitT family protein n=1 Tax=Pelosinus sp. IPA-1 TaxID=3029569 RepID=UPI0024361ADE|nr:YitT family protein [Pelosinus sp. IPA-1]GMA99056.1 membrane protein [Pelosinus sp. IPA-1]